MADPTTNIVMVMNNLVFVLGMLMGGWVAHCAWGVAWGTRAVSLGLWPVVASFIQFSAILDMQSLQIVVLDVV